MATYVTIQNESVKQLDGLMVPPELDWKKIQSPRTNAILPHYSDPEQRQPEEELLENSDTSGDELGNSTQEIDLDLSKDTSSGDDCRGISESACEAIEEKAQQEEPDGEVDIPKYQYAKSSNKKFLRNNNLLYFKIKATNVDRHVRENNVSILEDIAAASYMATLTYADSKLELVVIGKKTTTKTIQDILNLKTAQEHLMFYLTRKLNGQCHNVRITVVPKYACKITSTDIPKDLGEWRQRSVIIGRVPTWAALDLFEVLVPGALNICKAKNKDSWVVVEFANSEMANLFIKAYTEIRLQQHPLHMWLASEEQDNIAADVHDHVALKPRKRKVSAKSTDSSEVEELSATEQEAYPRKSAAASFQPLAASSPETRKAQSREAVRAPLGATEASASVEEVGFKKRKYGAQGDQRRVSSQRHSGGQGLGTSRKNHAGGNSRERGSGDSGFGQSQRGFHKDQEAGGAGLESPMLQQQMALLQQNMTFLTQAMMVNSLGMGMGLAGGRSFDLSRGKGLGLPGGRRFGLDGGKGKARGSPWKQGPRQEHGRGWGGHWGGGGSRPGNL